MQKLISSISRPYDQGELDNIIILGGEPLDNDTDDLVEFANMLREKFPNCLIWLYTHYELEEIEVSYEPILDTVDYIKCGAFDETKYSDQGFKDELTGVTLATSNQYFVKGNYNQD
jgi:organic radical activating enzyme